MTMWSAHLALLADYSATDPGGLEVLGATMIKMPDTGGIAQARAALGPARFAAAEQRRRAMALDTAAQFALLLSAKSTAGDESSPGIPQLSAREQELLVLVARGRTDAQIATELHISIRTVSSHLDRIRDRTGCPIWA